jgi:DNA-binding response OmpR family regulator
MVHMRTIEAELPVGGGMTTLAGMKILVVDDNRPTLRAITGYLEQIGCEARGAQTGLEAAFELWRYRPDLVMLDNQIPIVSGPALFREISKSPEFRDMPVIICSGSLTKDAVLSYLSAGQPNFLVKPFDMEQLVAALQNAFDGKKGTSMGAVTPFGDFSMDELLPRT